LTKYGNKFNTDWRDNIVKRAHRVGLPDVIANVFPTLIPILDGGEVVDVRLENKETLAMQQQRFGKIPKERTVSATIH